MYLLGLLALVRLHRIFFCCNRTGIPSFGYNKHVILKITPTHDALFDRSDRFLVECAILTSKECARSGPSISLLCKWFRQRVSNALQRSLAHAIHDRTRRLEQSMALLPPPLLSVPLSSSESLTVVSFCSFHLMWLLG